MLYEGWSLITSFYWVMVTITTVGYGDFAPSDQTSRFVMSFYILICAGLFGATTSIVIASHLAIQKRAMAVRFVLGNLSLTHLASYKTEVSRQYFMEFMLEKVTTQLVARQSGGRRIIDHTFFCLPDGIRGSRHSLHYQHSL